MITFGTPHRHVAQCGSTNDLAREWARDPDDPAPSGALVTADFQTRGRGQRGRQWQAGWGQSALMSLVYTLPSTVEAGQLGLVVALAVADALASLGDLDPRLKWPNDILLDGRKVAGVLVEVGPPRPQFWGSRIRRGSRREWAFFSYPPRIGGGGGDPRDRRQRQSGAVRRRGRVRLPTHLPADSDGPTAGGRARRRRRGLRADAAGRGVAAGRVCADTGSVPKASRRGRGRAAGGAAGGTRRPQPSGAARVQLADGTFADWHTVD